MMAKTKLEIIKELNQAQAIYDRTIMDIGQLYARYLSSNEEILKRTINEKVVTLQQVEIVLQSLEKELAQAK